MIYFPIHQHLMKYIFHQPVSTYLSLLIKSNQASSFNFYPSVTNLIQHQVLILVHLHLLVILTTLHALTPAPLKQDYPALHQYYLLFFHPLYSCLTIPLFLHWWLLDWLLPAWFYLIVCNHETLNITKQKQATNKTAANMFIWPV